jgi:hypothetical protein
VNNVERIKSSCGDLGLGLIMTLSSLSLINSRALAVGSRYFKLWRSTLDS